MSTFASGLAIAAGALLSGLSGASAQQVDGLRGEVQEDAITGELIGSGGSRYSPVMSGAIADEDPLDDRSATIEDDPLVDSEADETLVTGTVPPASGPETVGRASRAQPVNQRVNAIEGRNTPPEQDPYAPLGMRLGTFVVTPTLEQGIGWTSNAGSSADGEEAFFSETSLRLNAISDWSRHSAAIDVDATYRKSVSGAEIDEFEGGGQASFRQDLVGDFSALYALGYRVRPETAASPVTLPVGVEERPLRHTFNGGVGILKDEGKLRLGLRGDVVRDMYGDAELSDGTSLLQEERDSTLGSVTARVGYAVSPALAPFIETELGRRIYDLEVDAAGYDRSANRLSLRGGVEFDLGDKLRGEIAAGWLTERPDDDRLDDVSAPYAAGNLSWSPVRGTTVDLRGATTVEGSTTAGETGSVLYTSDLTVTHVLRHNLTATGLLGFDWRDYIGSSDHEYTLRGEVGLTWWMNRYAGLTGRARHEITRSTLADRSYDETSVYLGLTLQR